MQKKLAATLTGGFLGLVFVFNSSIAGAEAAAEVKYPGLRLPVSTNMPVGSVYYDYLDKLDGMGYITDMLYGAKPYSRVDMARWTMQARSKVDTKQTPAYLERMISELEAELQPEIKAWEAYWAGEETGRGDSLRLHEISVSGIYSESPREGYAYDAPAGAAYHPFSSYNNGYHYGHNGSLVVKGYLAGNLGREVALSASPRLSYIFDDKGSVALEEGYFAGRTGIFRIEAGKQALLWGQGSEGTLGLSNNARPLTMLKITTEERPKNRGLLAFLGKTRWSVFAGQLEGNRSDFSHPYLVGIRGDLLYDNLNIGFERLSMLGGTGNAFRAGDIGDWLVGRNAYSNDKWNDIAGIDIKYRFPGVHIYGELYGEDQAHAFPSEKGYSGGLYFPQLTPEGRMDLRIEGAYTRNPWYVHGTYRSGWTYHHDILGDAMGRKAYRVYAGVNCYLGENDILGFNGLYLQSGREKNTALKNNQAWVDYTHRFNASDSLQMTLGAATLNGIKVPGTDSRIDKFAKVTWNRRF